MRWVIAAILALSLAPPAHAGQVLVSVAQLDGSTRLVLTFENRPGWTASRTGQSLNVIFDSTGHQTLTSGGNAFGEGSRIASLSGPADGGSLVIELTCDCTTTVYPFGSGSLVVEVREALDLAEVGAVLTVGPTAPLPPDNAEAPPPRLPVRDSRVSLNSPPKLARSVLPADAIPDLSEVPWQNANTGLELIETLGFSIRSDDESQAVSLLARQLSRAAAQGLVEPDENPSEHILRSERGVSNEGLSGRSNISIVTSLDRDILAIQNRLPPTNMGATCFSDSDVDLMNWGDTTDFSTLGRLRRDAAKENGDIRPEGAKAIARYYIALGFGSEAANVATFMADGVQRQLIEALAEIVDHGTSASDILSGQIHCKGKVALWAALARPITPDDVPASTDPILSTFSALPPHHRAHLGPVLAERLRAVGLEDAARNAVNSVARGGLQSNESELVTARLELGGTRPDLARDTLVDISNGTDVAAAEALLELLKDAERRAMAPNPDWVEDAPSLARATEGTEVAALLNIAGLRGRIALGQFDALRLALVEDTPGIDDAARNRLSISALVEASGAADDAAFLRAEVGLSRLLKIDDMPRNGRFDVARRLTSVGLAGRAERYLPGGISTPEEAELVADIYLATGQADRAIEVLSNAAPDQTSRKLGQALSITGENETAILAFQKSGSVQDAAEAAMRAGNWTWIAENNVAGDSGTLSETAQILLAPPAVPVDPNNPGNGLLVKSSRELRRRAAELLSETQLSDVPQTFTN